MAAAQQPPIQELRLETADAKERELLRFWQTAVSQQHHQEGFNLATAHNREAQAVLFLKSLGALSHLAQAPEKAERQFAQGYALAQKIGFRKGIMLLGNNLGVVAYYAGKMAQAADYLQASLAEAERLNDHQAMSLVQANLAGLARQNGRSPSAAPPEHLRVFI